MARALLYAMDVWASALIALTVFWPINVLLTSRRSTIGCLSFTNILLSVIFLAVFRVRLYIMAHGWLLSCDVIDSGLRSTFLLRSVLLRQFFRFRFTFAGSSVVPGHRRRVRVFVVAFLPNLVLVRTPLGQMIGGGGDGDGVFGERWPFSVALLQAGDKGKADKEVSSVCVRRSRSGVGSRLRRRRRRRLWFAGDR